MKFKPSSAFAVLALIGSTAAATAQTVVIAPEQETVIREYVRKEPVASITLPGVELNVGSTIPETVELREIEAPDVNYRYVVVDDRTVLIDPNTRTIVRVLD